MRMSRAEESLSPAAVCTVRFGWVLCKGLRSQEVALFPGVQGRHTVMPASLW